MYINLSDRIRNSDNGNIAKTEMSVDDILCQLIRDHGVQNRSKISGEVRP